MKKDISRRELLVGTAAIGAASVFGVRATAQGLGGAIPVPTVLPQKVYKSEGAGISKRTHDEHLKLWQGYARKTNELRTAIAALDLDPAKANQITSQIRALKVDYSFAYQGFINHDIYFDTMGGSGGAASGQVASLITGSYGSFENWAKDWKATGLAARGWVYLGYDRGSKSVFNYIGDAQNSYPIWNHDCILAMDVYEHAYYLDFNTRRAAYIDAYMQCIDWPAVNARIPK